MFGVLFSMIAVPGMAQHDHGSSDGASGELPESFSEPIGLYPTALGSHTHPISSSNAEVQAYFNQGFQLMYAFAKEDATRSFREAWKRDPDCAICYWGEAWSWGSYLNGPMRPFEAPHAYAAMQEAVARLNHASETERAYITASSLYDGVLACIDHDDPLTFSVQLQAAVPQNRSVGRSRPWFYRGDAVLFLR